LDEMMAPNDPTPAGYLGLVFFGTKVAGHDAIGHEGATMTFFSDLKFFPEQGVGLFVSRDGTGEITSLKDLREMPHPATVIAERFFPKAPQPADARATPFPGDAGVAGIYHSSRRAVSSCIRLSELVSQRLVKIDRAGNARLLSAIWPFGDGETFRHVERNVYEGPASVRIAFMDEAGSESYIAYPAIRLQRVPWSLDVRWIAPAFAV